MASILQYRAQKFLRGRWVSLLINFISFFLIFYFLIFKNRTKHNSICNKGSGSIFLEFANRDIDTVQRSISFLSCEPIIIYDKNIGQQLSFTDIRDFLSNIYKYGALFEFYFILKGLFSLYKYKSLISNSYIKEIYVSYEFSFLSSYLTYYCSCYNIQHNNIMHGDKYFDIHDSYSSFHICYVWDRYYQKLFKKLRSITPEYKLVDLNILCSSSNQNKLDAQLVYYLGPESKDEMINVRNTLTTISSRHMINKNYIYIRPHPRRSNLADVRSVFSDFSIDLWDNECVVFCNANLIISKFSSMLIRGYKAKKNVYIDNVSDIEYYEKLKKLNFIGFHYNFKKISSLI